MTNAAARFYVVCLVLQEFVLERYNVPFPITVTVLVSLIWLYTRRGGIKTLVWTDTLQTFCMLTALVVITLQVVSALQLTPAEAAKSIIADNHSRVFVFDDWGSRQNFWKQFLSGIFVVIVMTGLDQDLMQRTLSSRNASESRKNMIIGGVMQVPVVFMFLCLGVLLYTYAAQRGISESGDLIFPAVATGGSLPSFVGVLFVLGLVSCAFSAGGSALTALTTSFTADIIGTDGKSEETITSIRKKVHLVIAALMVLCIWAFYLLNTKSAIDAVYKLASYTYGPILGMFAFGLCCKRKIREKWVPLVAVLAPILSFVLQAHSEQWFGGYRFSYELILVNALLTVAGMCLLIRKK